VLDVPLLCRGIIQLKLLGKRSAAFVTDASILAP